MAGRLDLALKLWEQTLPRMIEALGKDDPDTLLCMVNLTEGCWAAGQRDKAVRLNEEALPLMANRLGRDHDDTLNCISCLALKLKAVGRLEDSVPMLERLLRLQDGKFGPTDRRTVATLGRLGSAYVRIRQGQLAAAALTSFVDGKRVQSPPNDPRFAQQLNLVAVDLLECREHSTAEAMLREALAIRENKEPDAWTTFQTRSLLGAALLGQKKYADAESLLLKGYEGMKAREKVTPKGGETRIPEALDRLVELYTATKKPDEVKKWQVERARYPAATPSPVKK